MLLKKLKYHLKSAYINRYTKKPLGVAMFHFGRCGSTVVSELLNQNTNVKWDNELFQIIKYSGSDIFDTQFEKDYIKILENRYSRTKEKVYGFETKAIREAHLGREFLNLEFNVFLNKLVYLGFAKFIILKRTNLLKQLISIERGIQNQQFHFYNMENIKQEKINFNPERVVYGDYKGELLEIFTKMENQYGCIEKELLDRRINYLTLNYENDIKANPIKAYKKIYKYCDVPAEKVKVLQFKIGSKKIVDEIKNPEKLINYLKGTAYEWMIKE